MDEETLRNLRGMIVANLPAVSYGSHVEALGVFSMINFMDDLFGESLDWMTAPVFSGSEKLSSKQLAGALDKLCGVVNLDTNSRSKLLKLEEYVQFELAARNAAATFALSETKMQAEDQIGSTQ